MFFAIRYTFQAYERLKREQDIDTLFHSGKAFSVFPVRLIYRFVPRLSEVSPARVGFSVPKKKFRLAVRRNRVKRILREAWRLHKHELYQFVPPDQQLHIFIIFIDSAEASFPIVEKAIVSAIQHIHQATAHA